MLEFKYAIFDMDGTLIDSLHAWRNAASECAKLRGAELPDELVERMMYMSCEEGIGLLNADYTKDDPVTIGELFESVDKHYVTDVMPKKNAVEYLEQLKRKGVRMCVISATLSRFASDALNHMGMMKYFEFVITPDEFPIGKEKPDVFIEALSRFGAKPEETVLFEDELKNLVSAKSVGIKTVAIADFFNRRYTDELKATADEYFDDGFMLE